MCPQEITSLSLELVVFHSFGGVGYSCFSFHFFPVFFLLFFVCVVVIACPCFLYGRDNEIVEQLKSG